MAISGLVVTLSDDALAMAALSTLAADPRLSLGERFGRRVALVAETAGVDADRLLWEQLQNTAGITNVDVTYVHLDEDAAGAMDRSDTRQENQHAHR